MTNGIKPCPFCGSNKIDMSVKISGRFENINYHVQMYCKSCHTYGPRVLYKATGVSRHEAIEDIETCAKELAIYKWNERAQ